MINLSPDSEYKKRKVKPIKGIITSTRPPNKEEKKVLAKGWKSLEGSDLDKPFVKK